MKQYRDIVNFIKGRYPTHDFIPLHEPFFGGNEKKYVLDTIDSTFVSSVGEYVDEFEKIMADITGAKYAIAIINGTSALHMAMLLCGVGQDDEVLTQGLTFVATANAISYLGASPVFIDIDKRTLGMSFQSLRSFLEKNAVKRQGVIYNKITNRRISCCVPMHTFGLPCEIDKIVSICKEWNIPVVEDAAESLGSLYKKVHTGIFGKIGTFSFNGNKTVTCGGGGALVTNDESLARRAKHLTTQAKKPHRWDFVHDAIGYNYRMPNVNAALACAQLEQLEGFVRNKRQLAYDYQTFFESIGVAYAAEIEHAESNYWLNSILFEDIKERNEFLEYSNDQGVMTRPVWTLMSKMPMFGHCLHDGLRVSEILESRIVNIPSSVTFKK